MNNLPDNPISDDNGNANEKGFLVTEITGGEGSKEWKKKNKRQKKINIIKKILLFAFVILACLVLAVIITFLILRAVGKSQLLSDDVRIDADVDDGAIIYDDNTILYNDVLYEFNENITAILCMGIDRQNLTDTEIYGAAGQADALFLITVDTATGKTSVVSVPRDAMADIDLYSTSGSYLGTERKQLCIAYAYGDGREESCNSQKKAVSRFLYGMPINSYLAIDLSAIGKLNDAVGGVTVTVNETFSSSGYASYYKGQKLHLKGDAAWRYLKTRNKETVDSSQLRLERQTDYIKEYSSLAVAKTKDNLSFPITLFNIVSDNCVTDLNVSKITYLTSAMFTKRNDVTVEFYGIPGEQVLGDDEHAEFYADEQKLLELVLKLFYKPI